MQLAEMRPFLGEGGRPCLVIRTWRMPDSVHGREDVLNHTRFLIVGFLNQEGIVHDPIHRTLTLPASFRATAAPDGQERADRGQHNPLPDKKDFSHKVWCD